MKRISLGPTRRAIRVARDEHGVPHIEADNWPGALYGLGYMHGLDRPTQMLFARAMASGTSAVSIADQPQLLETDRFFRRAGLYLNLEQEVRALSDDVFSQLTAYCEGVNDSIKHSRRSLPMWAVGFQPQPWNHQAVMIVGNLLSFGGLAVGQQQNERLLLELIQLGQDDDRLRELFRPRLDDADFDLLRQVHISHQLSGEALELISDLPRLAGSNAWAVAPKRSASGAALLASDPHLEVNRLPAIWYEAVLKWQDRYLLGATLPGCPFVGVGRNPDLAWGVTYLKGDTSDYFIEDCRRGGSTGWQYRRGDAWRDFEARREVIERKSAEPEELTIYHNQQGTLDSSPGADDPEGYYLSVAWTGSFIGSGKAIETWLHLAQATTAAEAMQIVRVSPQPTLNWIFADRGGHIGKQASGWFPVRSSKYTGLLPIPAWDEANHWHGWHPPNMLPGVLDPPGGFVATANEDISPPGGPLLTTYPVPEYRKRRLDEVLAAMPSVTLLEMQQLQYDVLSLQARDMLAIFLPHLADGELKQRLTDWDLRYDPASVEASIYQELYRNVLLEIFGQSREEGGIGWRRMLYLSSRSGFSTMVLAAVDELLNRETSLWWKQRKKGDLIRAAAEKVNLAEAQPWSEVNSFHFANRFFQSDRVGRLFGFNTPAMPMRGCYATLFQGHLFQVAARATTFAPSYHFVTDLAEDEVHTNLPGGPSESRFSRYYRNDIPLWQEGKYKVLRPRGASDGAEPPG